MKELGYTDETWRQIAAIITQKIENDRSRLEDHAIDAAQTALYRGRISAFRELLALPIQRAAQAQEDEPQ
jgi:hypothetical protein